MRRPMFYNTLRTFLNPALAGRGEAGPVGNVGTVGDESSRRSNCFVMHVLNESTLRRPICIFRIHY